MSNSTTVIKAYKTELDPNNEQRGLFIRYAGAARFVFNWALADRKAHYEATGKGVSEYSQRKRFTAIKHEEYPWILDIPFAISEAAFANCNAAFDHFFRRVKAGEKPGYPKFKNRYGRKSFQLRNTKVEVDRVRLTGIGWVRLKERGYIPYGGGVTYGTYATISEQAGRWYISILVKEEVEIPDNDSTLVVGIDFGIKTLATLSNGETFENPKHLYKAERKLKRLQRELSRRTKGGQNWKKTKIKVQRAHAKVVNCRKHLLHQISHHVTEELRPGVIVLEDLNVRGMTSNGHLAKAIHDVSFAELRRQIEYKAERLGIKVIVADRWYGSSRICSECGWYNHDLTLSDRTFVCRDCDVIIDRDLNAAMNLASLAVEGEGGNTAGLPRELVCSNALL